MLLSTDKSRRPRHEHDVYSTPRGFVEQALDLVDGTPGSILDIGAGDGAWGQAARDRYPAAHLRGVELRSLPMPRAYDAWYVGDFTRVAPALPAVDLVIGNPPFGIAEECIRLALDRLNFGGCAVFLLRLAFLESQRRAGGLFHEHPPELVSVCASRPQFYGATTGVTAFAFYRWRRDYTGPTRLRWSVTSKGES
jgi:hypothetical protein